MSEPVTQPIPISLASRRRRLVWPWITGAITLVVVGLVITLSLVITDGDGDTMFADSFSALGGQVEPISRAELMAKYAEIAPLDTSATPDTVDGLAEDTCLLIENGTTTDELIEMSTDVYGPDATAVVQLLVSYKCPAHLGDFK